MSEYHKIQSLFLRDPTQNNKRFLMGQWALPEFDYLQNNLWSFTEKVDGTNVRVILAPEGQRFGGKTDNAQMPTSLLDRLAELFPPGKLAAAFDPGTPAVLYGEGYGAHIQKGGGDYLPNGRGFILFDVFCGGSFLERKNVEDIAAKLSVPIVPVVGQGTLHDALAFAMEPHPSQIAANQRNMEGIVMRPAQELRTRRGHRVISKLKLKDFQ